MRHNAHAFLCVLDEDNTIAHDRSETNFQTRIDFSPAFLSSERERERERRRFFVGCSLMTFHFVAQNPIYRIASMEMTVSVSASTTHGNNDATELYQSIYLLQLQKLAHSHARKNHCILSNQQPSIATTLNDTNIYHTHHRFDIDRYVCWNRC